MFSIVYESSQLSQAKPPPDQAPCLLVNCSENWICLPFAPYIHSKLSIYLPLEMKIYSTNGINIFVSKEKYVTDLVES